MLPTGSRRGMFPAYVGRMNPTNALPNEQSNPLASILETYFFSYIDRGIGADETPLFTRTLDGTPLSSVVAEKFDLPRHYAEAAIDMARQEMAL